MFIRQSNVIIVYLERNNTTETADLLLVPKVLLVVRKVFLQHLVLDKNNSPH